jgi:hypothetical protein
LAIRVFRGLFPGFLRERMDLFSEISLESNNLGG